MTTHIALLRAVNVGGKNAVAMAALVEFFLKLGFTTPRTLLQSGNVVFGSPSRPAELEALLEVEAKGRLGLDTAFLVRRAREWQRLIAQNPFPLEAKRDPSHLLVLCLKDAPSQTAVAALRAAIRGPELVQTKGREAYVVYPAGIGTSRLTMALIEGKLGTRGTGRNWNTVLKLATLASP
jgi:uncharacterized protein (DUF1697 family)